MELIYLYCAFSYLFMIGVDTGSHESGDNSDSVIRGVAVIFSPLVMPFIIGAFLGDTK